MRTRMCSYQGVRKFCIRAKWMMPSADKHDKYRELKVAFGNAVVIAENLLSGEDKNIAVVSYELLLLVRLNLSPWCNNPCFFLFAWFFFLSNILIFSWFFVKCAMVKWIEWHHYCKCIVICSTMSSFQWLLGKEFEHENLSHSFV